MGHLSARVSLPLLGLLLGCSGQAALEPGEAGPDFAVQGEYRSEDPALGAQVIARGGGRFSLVLLDGGLPGEGWDGSGRRELHGAWKGRAVVFAAEPGLRLEAGRIRGERAGAPFSLGRIERVSPTLGAPPPAGALVLFDGSGPGGFDGTVDARGFLEAGATSREEFDSFDLHVEFRTPFMPTADGQSRGNSGVYLQKRYEVQVLDSFGEPPAVDGAGSLYGLRPPDLNLSYPPLSWQTYDIAFRAARFAPSRERTRPARVTVRHNGVLIHDDVAFDGPTGLGRDEGPSPGALLLQDHGDPVFFRNVWLLPRE